MAFLRRLKIGVVGLAALGAIAAGYDKFVLSKIQKEDVPHSTASGDGPTFETAAALGRISAELPNLFPDENDWRRVSANAIVPADGSCVFLFKGQPTVSDDRKLLTLNACTTILLPPLAAGLSDADRRRRAFVFEASDKTKLVFSRPIADFSNLERMSFDFSAFESGRLGGNVSICSQMGTESPEDDISFNTREVVFTSRQIRTNFDVAFRFGRNAGNGKGLTIDLDASALSVRSSRRSKSVGANASEDADGGELDFASLANPEEELKRRLEAARDEGNLGGGFSIERIELDELVGYSRFYLADAKKLRGESTNGGDSESGGENASTSAPSGPSDDAYVEIRGKRGVYFSSNPDALGGWCVRFAGDVELVAYDKGEKQAQAHCDALYIYLQDPVLEKLDKLQRQIAESRGESAADGDAGAEGSVARRFGGFFPTGALARLEPVKIRALGAETAQGAEAAPASVKAGPNGEYALTADELLFDLRERRFDLTTDVSERPARVVGVGENEFDFSAPTVRISLDENDEPESAVAGGAGTLATTTRDKSGAPSRFQASWRDGLRLVRDKERPEAYRLSAAGGTAFALENIGVFSAEEADFWGIAERESKADGDDSTRFRFKSFVPVGASFRKNVKLQSTRGDAEISNEVAVRFGSPAEVAASAETPEGAEPGANGALAASGDSGEKSFFSNGSTFGEEKDSRFELRGEKLDLWCVSNAEPGRKVPSSVELYRATIRGGVSLVERSTIDGSVSTELLADEADLDEPGTERARVRLVGSTASFRRKDLALDGYDVVVDRARNRFDVRGPGKLKIVPPKQASREASASGADASDPASALAGFVSDEPVEVQWSKGTTFDGRVLSFQAEPGKYATIAQRTQTLRCAEVRLTLAEEKSIFDFNVGNAEKKDEIDFESLECLGDEERPVRVDAIAFGNEGSGERGGTAAGGRDSIDEPSYYRAVLRNLTYYRKANEFVASGGGAFYASMRTKGKLDDAIPGLGAIGGGSGGSKNGGAKDDSADGGLLRVHLIFQDRLVGSLDKREVVATGGARVVASTSSDPSAKVDAADFDPSSRDSFFVSGDEATVKTTSDSNDSSAPNASAGSNGSNASKDASALAKKLGGVEIDARGNVVFRNRTFGATCNSLKFDSKKNVAIVSGEGANKAQVFEQAGPGARREKRGEFSSAVYRLSSGKFDLEGVAAGN